VPLPLLLRNPKVPDHKNTYIWILFSTPTFNSTTILF